MNGVLILFEYTLYKDYIGMHGDPVHAPYMQELPRVGKYLPHWLSELLLKLEAVQAGSGPCSLNRESKKCR